MADKSDKQHEPVADEKPYNAVPIPAPTEERPTEDDLAQATLGGPRGSKELKPQKLTKTEAEQNMFPDEPGHVA